LDEKGDCMKAKLLKTELPANMKPTNRTIRALLTLEKNHVVKLQFDDSMEDYIAAQQLQEIAREVGYSFVWKNLHLGRVAFLIDEEVEEE